MVPDPELPIKLHDRSEQKVLRRGQEHSHSGWKHQIRIDQRGKQARVCGAAEVVHSGKDQLHPQVPRARHFTRVDNIETKPDFRPDTATLHVKTEAQLRHDAD